MYALRIHHGVYIAHPLQFSNIHNSLFIQTDFASFLFSHSTSQSMLKRPRVNEPKIIIRFSSLYTHIYTLKWKERVQENGKANKKKHNCFVVITTKISVYRGLWMYTISTDMILNLVQDNWWKLCGLISNTLYAIQIYTLIQCVKLLFLFYLFL